MSSALHCVGGWESECPRHGRDIARCFRSPRVVPEPVIVRRRRSPLQWLVDAAVPAGALRWGALTLAENENLGTSF